MRSAENRKRKLPDSDVVAEFDDTYPYSVYVNLKQAATGKWHEHLRLVEVVQMKGNFWSRCGFSQQSVNYLYPEEALMLVERGQLQMQGSDGQPMPSSVFYEIVIAEISLPVYLTYIKLRSLELIIQRYDKTVLSLDAGAEDFKALHRSDPTKPLLSHVASFKVYSSENWTKRNADSFIPCGHVIIVHGDRMPPPDVFVQLLDDSAGIPLIYGIMLPSGFIFLQEFSDALESIIWNPILPAGTGCDRNGLSTDETQNGEDAESISICSASSNSRKLVDCTIDIRTTVESELTCERVISADATIVALGNGAGDADDSQG